MQFLCMLHTYLPYIDQLEHEKPKELIRFLQRMHVRLHTFSKHTYSLSHHMHIFQLEAKLKMHTKKIYKQQQKQQQQQHNPTTLNNGYFSFTTYFPHIFFCFFSSFFHLDAVLNVYGCFFLFVLFFAFISFFNIFFLRFLSTAKAVLLFSVRFLSTVCVCVCVLLPFCY